MKLAPVKAIDYFFNTQIYKPMKIPSLMKVNKHKRFNFEPRYYDPIKERIDEKIAEVRRENGGDDTQASYSARISDAFNSRQRKSQGSSTTRLFFIFILAAIGFTYVLFGDAKISIGNIDLPYGEFAPFLLVIAAIGYIFMRLKKKS
ncbi:hypothetical protein M23134_00423 [Microscilla marina ATCC 23134]|uniref:Uncharacterized protein n=2 Tax=Microscilla marina TaxID=1027 RepID=A1ZJ03_MICM2|nr:hypothetical protein M23134_00423 [Microscilla marina ATCC 23134]